jgi:hypothetical protein
VKRPCSLLLVQAVLLAPLHSGEDTTPIPGPTAIEIVARMVAADDARMPKLRDYTSLRHYSLENKRFGVRASMTVRVAYRFPGNKQFDVIEESGPSAIRKRVFRRMLDSELQASAGAGREETRISSRNYNFRLAGSRVVDGRQNFQLEAIPKTKNPLLFRGLIYVDAEDYAVTLLDGSPAQNPSFWLSKTAILHKYGKFGPFWLPLSNESDSDVKVFGHTQVLVQYSDYKINVAEVSEPAVSK